VLSLLVSEIPRSMAIHAFDHASDVTTVSSHIAMLSCHVLNIRADKMISLYVIVIGIIIEI